MPSWVFLELVPFGTLVDFIRFCGARWDDKDFEQSHYDLKKVKSVRNCAAHGSCIINTFAEGANSRRTTSRKTLEAVAKRRGFFNAVEGAGDLLPKTGPDATAAAAINFIRSLTKSLGLLDLR